MLDNIIQESDVARLVSALGLLTGSGVLLDAVLSASKEVAGLASMRKGFEKAGEAVEQDTSLAWAMTDARCFPPIVPLLIGGEGFGRLPRMLDDVARRISVSVGARIDTMVRLFEPAVALFMGRAVLLIVPAVLLPIFEMNQLVK